MAAAKCCYWHKLTTDGGHYSPRDFNSRYDWLTLNHFVDMSAGDLGVTLSSADCYFMRLGNSTNSQLDTQTPHISVLSGGRVVGTGSGIYDQGGADYFLQRFALGSHGTYDPVSAMKLALEHQNPFVTGALTGSGSGAYPETTHSLLRVSNPDVLLWALKPHEDGIEHGLVARLWNLSDKPANTEVFLALAISGAYRTTHIETDIEAVPLTAAGTLPATFTRQQIQTYRFKTR